MDSSIDHDKGKVGSAIAIEFFLFMWLIDNVFVGFGSPICTQVENYCVTVSI